MLSGNLFGNNNLFNQNQSVWNKNQYQKSTPWAKQSADFESNQPVQTKPVYENPNPRRYSTGEILWDGVKGIFQGSVSGLESLANDITLGGYDLLDDAYGLGAKERRQILQQTADNAPIESFFGHLKDEVDLKSCQTFDELKIKVENYIYYYNNERCQWNLNKMTPAQCRCHLLNPSS